MPVIRQEHAQIHEFDGGRWASYASPSRGSRQLCAWRADIPVDAANSPHRVSHEEVAYVLKGKIRFREEADESVAETGDVLVIPPDTDVHITNAGDQPAAMWVTTSVGFQAALPGGEPFAPAWAR